MRNELRMQFSSVFSFVIAGKAPMANIFCKYSTMVHSSHSISACKIKLSHFPPPQAYKAFSSALHKLVFMSRTLRKKLRSLVEFSCKLFIVILTLHSTVIAKLLYARLFD